MAANPTVPVPTKLHPTAVRVAERLVLEAPGAASGVGEGLCSATVPGCADAVPLSPGPESSVASWLGVSVGVGQGVGVKIGGRVG
jgi:hypothetical protein